MKKPLIFVVIVTLISSLFFISCKEKKETEELSNLRQLSLRSYAQNIIKDTFAYSPVVDSLKRQFKISGDTAQILLLNELSENWAPHAYHLADEGIHQSNKINFKYGEADAFCRLGIYYYRHSNPDSADYFLSKAYSIAEKNKWNKIKAQAISLQAEVLRQKGELDKVLELQDKAFKIAFEENDKKRMAFCLISKGEAFRTKGLFEKAFDCYFKCISYASEINDINKIIVCYNSMGDIYRIKGDYVKSLEYFNKALSSARKNVNKLQIAFCLNSIGDIYNSQKDYDKALTYYNDGIKVALETKSKFRVSNMYGSMGSSYQAKGNNEMAFECFDRSLKIAEEIGYKDNIAFASGNIGALYFSLKDYSKALEYYKIAKDIAEETGNAGQMADFLFNIGECHYALKNINLADVMVKQSLAIAQETQLLANIKQSAYLLYKIKADMNQPQAALEMLTLNVAMKDSINNEENVKQFAAVEFKAKEDKLKAEQTAQEKMFKAEQAMKEEELKRQKTIRYAFTIGFGLVLILAIVIYRGLRINKQQNKIITAQKKEVEHQKELVDEKNKEITDSITYAKRLQEAILPPLKMVRQIFPESFIIYKPKDIIAGDFYWMQIIEDNASASRSELILFAAADSTGHGVPGAMVSVVCSNALNRAVKEFQLKEPGKILDKTRELVIETFEKSEGEVKDGMDISLLSILRTEGSDTPLIQWAGANNPLWYLSTSNIGQTDLKEIKATKQPIGKSDNPQPFATHTIPYEKDTVFYLLTDGYADQFGGPKGKKYKYKQLEELIVSKRAAHLSEQEISLTSSFESWKGHFDQVDDVTIIGIKI